MQRGSALLRQTSIVPTEDELPPDEPQFLTVPIRDLQVMHHRVMAHNPLRDEVTESVGEIDPGQWRVVTLVHSQPDGSEVIVQRGLPLQVIHDELLWIGDVKWVSLPENSIEGNFEVTAIDPCPTPAEGDGQLVTTKFIHENAEVYDLIVGRAVGIPDGRWRGRRQKMARHTAESLPLVTRPM